MPKGPGSLPQVEQTGYLLIADITGYTTYLTRSELEHAEQTLTALMELLVDQTPPPMSVAQLEGDAVLSYAIDDVMPSGQTFIETIDTIYVEFRRALELMVINTSCDCNACANIGGLDLKFFVHHGAFVEQPVFDHRQLLGSDVNLIHRLLKNSVTESTGISAYLLITEDARQSLGIVSRPAGLKPHTERVPDFGDLNVWVRDVHHLYDKARNAARSFYSPNEVLMTLETEIDAPRHVVWDHLRDSQARNAILGSDRYEIDGMDDGWIGEGASYKCYHGNSILPQLVVEWSPPSRLVLQELIPILGGRALTTLDFTLEAKGPDTTKLELTATKPRGPALQRTLGNAWMRIQGKRVQRGLERFGDLVARSVTSEAGW